MSLPRIWKRSLVQPILRKLLRERRSLWLGEHHPKAPIYLISTPWWNSKAGLTHILIEQPPLSFWRLAWRSTFMPGRLQMMLLSRLLGIQVVGVDLPLRSKEDRSDAMRNSAMAANTAKILADPKAKVLGIVGAVHLEDHPRDMGIWLQNLLLAHERTSLAVALINAALPHWRILSLAAEEIHAAGMARRNFYAPSHGEPRGYGGVMNLPDSNFSF